MLNLSAEDVLNIPKKFKTIKKYSTREIKKLLKINSVNLDEKKYLIYDVRYGLCEEEEHNKLINDDNILKIQIVLDHLTESPYYYRALFYMTKFLAGFN